MNAPRAAVMAGAVTLLVSVVLLLDGSGFLTQLGLGSVTLLSLLLMVRRSASSPYEIGTAIVIATAGECMLSLAWGLYEYRSGLIPLYVPFGHGIFYLLAAETARVGVLQRREALIRVSVLTVSGGWAVAQLFAGDQWGFIWWLIAAGFIVRSTHPLLLSLCYVYTFALEIAGTSLGNWRWAAEVPGLGLRSGNPPSGVGVLYCVLDVCTLAVMGWVARARAESWELRAG